MSITEALLITADSDRQTYEDCLQVCRDVIANPPESEVWTDAEKIKFGTQDALKDYFETRLDDPAKGLDESTGCLVMTLIADCLSKISWGEVARHYRRKLEGGAA